MITFDDDDNAAAAGLMPSVSKVTCNPAAEGVVLQVCTQFKALLAAISNVALFFTTVPAAVLQALRRRQPRAVNGGLSRGRGHVHEHGVSDQRLGPRASKVRNIYTK